MGLAQRLLMREEAEARPAEARVTVGKPHAPRKGGGTASALQPRILLLLSWLRPLALSEERDLQGPPQKHPHAEPSGFQKAE